MLKVFYTEASGADSHAEGTSTLASGHCSHAEGDYTKASGYMAHSQNQGTIAQGMAQTAIGKFNVEQGTIDEILPTDQAFLLLVTVLIPQGLMLLL